MIHNKKGYILSLSLILIFLTMFLATYIANRGSLFGPYAQLAIERKKAYVLAESGVQLAMSQLIAPKVKKKKPEAGKEGKKQKPTPEQKIKDVLSIILPSLNRWQTVTLTKKIDGVDAKIAFCIMSENGKFDLNALYDFDKHTFKEGPNKADTQKALKDVFGAIKGATGGKDLFAALQGMLKKRSYKLNDATELLTKEFAAFKNAVFYEPPSKGDGKKRPVYLTDLFTVWTGKAEINPWLLSDSVCAAFKFSRATPDDVADRKKKVAQWLKPFKLKSNWQKDWKSVLQPIYQKEYNSISKSLQPFLSSTFEAQVFSVLSVATVGRITQRLLAIVEIGTSSDKQLEASIKKVYWL